MRTPDSTLLDVGHRITAARVKARLTQLELAHRIGRAGDDAGAHICRLETGVQEPRLGTLIQIAHALGVSLESLLPT